MTEEILQRRDDRVLTRLGKAVRDTGIHGAQRPGHCWSTCPRSDSRGHPVWSAPTVTPTCSATSREHPGLMGGRRR